MAPLCGGYTHQVADLKNSVKDRSNAQSSCAGTFIGEHLHPEYQGGWLHCDMAGPADAKERDPAGMHDNTIDMHNGMGNTVHRTAAVTHDSLVIEQAPRKRYAFHVVFSYKKSHATADAPVG